jgi:hypothetical protein
VELVPDTQRLALMNAMLHGMDCDVLLGDTLSPMGASVPRSDVILANPPFGTKKGGGGPTRDDFTFPTSNKQLAFVSSYTAVAPSSTQAGTAASRVWLTHSQPVATHSARSVGGGLFANILSKASPSNPSVAFLMA